MAQTEIRMSILEQAVVLLSSHCDQAHSLDGVGYNRHDATIMNDFARQILDGQPLSPKQQNIAYDKLSKYAGQLEGFGMTYIDIPVPGMMGFTPRQSGEPPTWANRTDRSAGQPAGVMVARMGGMCAQCRGPIAVGEQFVWGQARGARQHLQCPSKAPVVQPAGAVATGLAVPPQGLVVRDGGLTVDDIIGPKGLMAQQLPGYESRPQQLGGGRLISQGLRERRCVVVEAGTGTGKSAMAMAAAAVERLNGGPPCIIVTADKSLQAQYRDKDAPFLSKILAQAGYTWRASELKGRANYLCKLDVQEKDDEAIALGEPIFKTAEAAAQWPELSLWANNTPNGDFEQAPIEFLPATRAEFSRGSDTCIGEKCAHYTSCWAQQARERSRSADATVVNMALFGQHMKVLAATDGNAHLIPIGQPKGKPSDDDPDVECTTAGGAQPLVIIDEAHELEEWATKSFGVQEMTPGKWYRLRDRLQHLTTHHKAHKAALKSTKPADVAAVAKAQAWLERADGVALEAVQVWRAWTQRLQDTDEGAMRLGDEMPLAGPLLTATGQMGTAMEDGAPIWLDGQQREQWLKLGKAYQELAIEFQHIITPTEDDNWVRYATQDAETRTVTAEARPVEPAELLREHLWNSYPSVIALSATLATSEGLRYWKDRVGAPNGDGCLEMVVPAPFNYARQAVMYLPANGAVLDPRKARDLTSHDGRRYLANLCAELYQLADATNGGQFFLFTSRRMLHAVLEQIGPDLRDRWLVLVQGEAPRPELTRLFRENGNAILFGLKSFWQGVDVPGTALRGVAIDKLPFSPPTDPVWSAKCELVDRRKGRNGASFKALAIPTATIAFKQGFGRLIRTGKDYGVVALLDGRLTMEWYGRTIVAALPPATEVRSLAAVREFYLAQQAAAAQ
jgi:ATP-dependent DNA helicase DinG